MVAAGLGGELALGAQVVLDVAGALHRPGVLGALELAEDLAVGLAGDVGQDVEPAAVRHADADLVEVGVGGGRTGAVEQGDDRLAALEAEPLLPDELGLQERLERLGGVEPTQDAQLLLARGLGVLALDPGLDPARAGRGPGCACTRCRWCGSRSRAARRGCGAASSRLAAEPAGGELAVEVPQRQPVGLDVEVGVAALAVLERVGVGHQVAAHAVGVDQLLARGRSC